MIITQPLVRVKVKKLYNYDHIIKLYLINRIDKDSIIFSNQNWNFNFFFKKHSYSFL